MTDQKRAREICLIINWTAAYADFKSRNCTLSSYCRNYFEIFLISYGITDYVPNRATVLYRFKKVKAQLGSLLDNEASAQAQESACSTTENEPTHKEEVHGTTSSDTDPSQVAVFDLEKLVATATSAPAPTNKANPPLATATPHLCSGSLSFGMSQLNVEWGGMRFSYPCLDPGQHLALLLYRLKELEEEARHAH